jgi:hypothetical protein
MASPTDEACIQNNKPHLRTQPVAVLDNTWLEHQISVKVEHGAGKEHQADGTHSLSTWKRRGSMLPPAP